MDQLTTLVRQYEEKHKVSYAEKAKHDVIPVVETIRGRIGRKDSRFSVDAIDYTGSMYQKVKIDKPDEFDFDFPLSELEIEERAETVTSSSTEYAYYTPQERHKWDDLSINRKLSAERVVQAFAKLVGEVLDDLNRERNCKYRLSFKTNHPAVTVKFSRDGQTVYDVDLVPMIKIKSWPDNLTKGWKTRKANGWPSSETKNEVERLPFGLVPKFRKGVTIAERDISWRYSFNDAEKFLLLDSEPSFPSNNCRRSVLRILKSLRVDYNWDGIRSYHLKTTMLHEFESHNPRYWKNENIFACLQKALNRLKVFVQIKNCPHYFLPGVNLFATLSEQDRAIIIQDLDNFLRCPKETLEKLNGKESRGPQFQIKTDQEFQIFVTDLNGKTMPYKVKNETSIVKLKDMISANKGISKDQFRLVYKGHNLENGTIQSNGIIAGNTLLMHGRLRGGHYSF